MTVWNDISLHEWGDSGGLDPFDPACVNPASVDLRWSGRFRVAQKIAKRWSDEYYVDELVMTPGSFYLLDTMEYIRMPHNAVGKLFLKSSAGRMGIEHLHAGYVDPEFEGTLTLEIETRVPWELTIEKGKRLVQLTIEMMTASPLMSYSMTGRYQGQSTPTLSKGLPGDDNGHT